MDSLVSWGTQPASVRWSGSARVAVAGFTSRHSLHLAAGQESHPMPFSVVGLLLCYSATSPKAWNSRLARHAGVQFVHRDSPAAVASNLTYLSAGIAQLGER